jgi:signal transduction histidine kinase/HAMP domain-containing protein
MSSDPTVHSAAGAVPGDARLDESCEPLAQPPLHTPAGAPRADGSLDERMLLAGLVAIRRGDFSVRLPEAEEGIAGRLAEAFNDVVELNERMAKELARLSRVVGRDGKISERASIGQVGGAWHESVDSINMLITDLVHPIRDTARVIGAVANGDLSKTMATDIEGRLLCGEFLRTATTVNTMVHQLASFASEVTRVAREVGTEGKLGGQASVPGVAGTWKDLTDNVNSMAGNLTSQVRNIAAVTTAVAKGDLSKKITVDVKGEILELKDTINTMVDQLNSFAAEVTRVAREVGTEGKLGGQASVPGVAGTWKDLTDNVNSMGGNLTSQVRNIAAVTTAVAKGDLSKKITVDVKGEMLELKDTINTMVDQLNSFATEVTRVAREVGTEGKLGGQANVPGVAGTWKDLTDNVNSMAGNLTSQVRNIAAVTTAVAKGDLSKKITVDVKGEILELKDTINTMVDQLNAFASEVTRVAREVGIEGKLGGQASVPGVAGTWKDLTDNVNQLAANLTTQVRAIAEVATAVTTGDLTRSIAVAARGEVAALKDNINEMIRNLKDTTLKNSEQDWLKTNLAKFSRMLQGQRDLLTVGRLILSELAPVVSAQQGLLYVMDFSSGEEPVLRLLTSYATQEGQAKPVLRLGESLVGQCALDKQKILLTDLPSDHIRVSSGLGRSKPLSVIVMPVVFEGQVKAVLELASSGRFSPIHQDFLDPLAESIGVVLNTIESTMRTEDLLKQSQSLTNELQSQQLELQETNAQLQEKARQLVEQNVEVERKSHEVEQARQALEEKAEQLALTSKYKSEFLANMSHELRTPLNNLLILSEQLARNTEKNLMAKQVEYSKTIHSSGNDLLTLINDILDLSKIESGTVVLDLGTLSLADLRQSVERTFGHVAEARRLKFAVELSNDLPPVISTDAKRLQQVLKNLLSNAFKFTDKGSVRLEIGVATAGWRESNEQLQRAGGAVAFRVCDTGIGIPPEKQAIIFEAFQQADGSTSRKYGGTGLGLAISREITRLLGGELVLISKPGEGSTFTLYVPLTYPEQPAAIAALQLPDAAVLDRPEEAADACFTRRSPFEIAPAEEVPQPDPALAGKHVLIVDDDVRNIFAMTSVLEPYDMHILSAENGNDALGVLGSHEVDVVLMDIMMPEMDGYDTMRAIRSIDKLRNLPIIALTAKAMKGDREKCLQAGAWDYISKPVDINQLLGTLRSWLRK